MRSDSIHGQSEGSTSGLPDSKHPKCNSCANLAPKIQTMITEIHIESDQGRMVRL